MAFSGAWRSLVPLALLVLLVLLPASQPSNDTCIRWREVNRSMMAVRETLQSCPEDCNSTQIIEPKCKCLSLNTTEGCMLPCYLISGLEALNRTLPESRIVIKRLMYHLNMCKTPDSLNLTCQASASPGSFIQTLAMAQEQIHSWQA